jgi:hypothetical protein
MAIQHLFLGFGGTGAFILTFVKEMAVQKYGRTPKHISFLEFDTIADWNPGDAVPNSGGGGEQRREKIASGEEISLDPNTEYLQLKDATPSLVELCTTRLSDPQKRAQQPQLADWLHSDWLMQTMGLAQLNLKEGAAQARQIGRYAMFANANAIVNELKRRLTKLKSQADQASINVWIVGSAAGGTGAGCLIDAAYLARLAAAQVNAVVVTTGVIVLPEVYSDVFTNAEESSAAKARSYSFFRELDRVEFPLEAQGRYSRGGQPIQSDVVYDAGGQIHSQVPGKLFDYRVYLSESCTDEESRKAFFSSVASALDAFTDENIGAQLLQAQVNASGAPIGLGAARLLLPKSTYAERFAWQEVKKFFEAVCAPNSIVDKPNEVYWGSDNDRQTAAKTATRGFLTLFNELLRLKDARSGQPLEEFAKNSLSPRQIVENWFQFATVEPKEYDIRPEDLDTNRVLLYCNPFMSIGVGADVQVLPDKIAVKTYSENQKSKGVKEDQKSSAQRFAQDLNAAKLDYLEGDGKYTFNKAAEFVRKLNAARLSKAVDAWVTNSLAAPARVPPDEQRFNDGTPITRLLREIGHIIGATGPLSDIKKVLATFKTALNESTRDGQLEQIANDYIADLANKADKPPAFSLTTWVEAPQKEAREALQAFVASQQRDKLLSEVAELVASAEMRLTQWRDCIRKVLYDEFVLGTDQEKSVLSKARGRINELDLRLMRIAKNNSIVISLGRDEHDTTMDGYESVLRGMTLVNGQPKYEEWLQQVRWLPSVGKDGRPQVIFNIKGLEVNGPDGPRELYLRLYDDIRKSIDTRLDGVGILNYLSYTMNDPKLQLDESAIIAKLRNKCRVKLSVEGIPEAKYRLIYNIGNHANIDMVTKANNLVTALRAQGGGQVANPATDYSDPNTIILFGAIDPNGQSVIADVNSCGTEYLKSYTQFKGDPQMRTLTYHIFRAEQEAWFIERHAEMTRGEKFSGVESITPPRIVRLLEKPDMMRAFVHCLVTGVVYRDDTTSTWYYKPKDGEAVPLGDAQSDLLQAIVIFVLQQRSSAKVLRTFTADSAIAAAVGAAQSGPFGSYPAALKDAVDNPKRLDDIVTVHFEQVQLSVMGADDHRRPVVFEEANALRRIFRFYAPYASNTELPKRKI